jgi:hypothetical protein
MGGFLPLCAAGAGKYSIEASLAPPHHNLRLSGRRCNVTSRMSGAGQLIDDLVDSHSNEA